MINKYMKTPSPSMAISLIALFVALTGTAYAASLPKNSVTTATIKNNAVTGAKVKSSTLTGSDVKNDSLTGSDVNESSLGTVPSAASAASAAGVAANSIDSASVKNNSLDGNDVAHASGTTALDVPSINANTCGEVLLNINNGVDMTNDAFVLTPEDSWPSGLVLFPENSNSTGYVRVDVCNVTGSAIDPNAMPFHWLAFKVDQ